MGLSRAELDREVWAIDAAGARYAGAAAANRVLRELPGWRGFAVLYEVAPIGWIEDRVYDWIAAHRGWLPDAGAGAECSRPGVECAPEEQ